MLLWACFLTFFFPIHAAKYVLSFKIHTAEPYSSLSCERRCDWFRRVFLCWEYSGWYKINQAFVFEKTFFFIKYSFFRYLFECQILNYKILYNYYWIFVIVHKITPGILYFFRCRPMQLTECNSEVWDMLAIVFWQFKLPPFSQPCQPVSSVGRLTGQSNHQWYG